MVGFPGNPIGASLYSLRYACERKFELEAVLKELEELGVSCQVSVQPQRQSRHFPHSRILEVHRQDGQQYKVVFDMGFDFLDARTDGMYCVTKPTYVVVTCQASTVSR